MTATRQTEIHRHKEERNKLIVDWSTGILAVFWSVWWAYFADKVLQNKNPLQLTTGLAVSMEIAAFVMAAYVAFFAHEYVRWMWLARKLNYQMQLRSFFRIMSRFVLVLVGFLGASVYLCTYLSLSSAYAIYGVSLTLGWAVAISVGLLEADKWK